VQTTYEGPTVIRHEEKPIFQSSTLGTRMESHQESAVVKEVMERPIIKEHHKEVIHEHHQNVVREQHQDVIHETHRPVITEHIQPVIHETHIHEKHQPIIHETERQIIHEKNIPVIHERHEQQIRESTKGPIVHELQGKAQITKTVEKPIITQETQAAIIKQEGGFVQGANLR
jgi:hypothetical protein